MSLHAQLNPEAQAKLAAMRRNSTISSIIIALFLCAALVAILWWIAIEGLFKNNEETISYAASSDKESEVTKPEMTNEVETKPSSPASNTAKVIAANTPSPVAIPVPDITTTEPSLDFGDGDDFGEGWGSGAGDGSGAGSGGFGIPASMQKRCSLADRLKRLAAAGGSPKCEEAVVKGLRYLAKTQNADGSWSSNKPVGITGLCLLAYLGHCETPASVEFGEVVQNAILYLVNSAIKNDGKLSSNLADNHWCYEHAIATYALAEAYTLCKQFKVPVPQHGEAVVMAGGFIVDNQHSSGGWDYAYDKTGKRGGDTSIVCWHLQALKAIKHTKLEIEYEKAAKKGLKYLERCQRKNGGFGYTETGAPWGDIMTGGCVLCLQQWGKGGRSAARKGVRWIKKNGEFDYNTPKSDLYAHYYNGQAMMNAGGKNWAWYNEQFMTSVIDGQNADGSFKDVGGGNKVIGAGEEYNGNGGYAPYYRASLCILMLEVYYRFLPGS